MGLSGFGAAAGPKAPYVSAQTGPPQPVLALTWTTLVADAWGCRADRSEAEADRPTPIFLFFDFPVYFSGRVPGAGSGSNTVPTVSFRPQEH